MALWANVINTVSMVDNTNDIDSLELSKRLLDKLCILKVPRSIFEAASSCAESKNNFLNHLHHDKSV